MALADLDIGNYLLFRSGLARTEGTSGREMDAQHRVPRQCFKISRFLTCRRGPLIGFGRLEGWQSFQLSMRRPARRRECRRWYASVARSSGKNPRLVVDPPPYRRNALFRGPLHVLIDIDGIRD